MIPWSGHYTLSQLAKLVGVEAGTLRNYRKYADFPQPMRVNGRELYTAAAVQRWMQQYNDNRRNRLSQIRAERRKERMML
jgi:DNA-binding transcriptional MerR regulator